MPKKTKETKSEKPSLAINPENLAQAEAMAEDITRAMTDQPEQSASTDQPPAVEDGPPVRKRGRPRKTAGASSSKPKKEGEASGPPPLDPEFIEMLKNVFVEGGVEQAKTLFKWTDPGEQWKEKVGFCVAKLANRIKPMQDSWITDVVTIAGYVGLWGTSNVLLARANKSADGDNGERKDVPTSADARA
jgi:hypothetical protein